MPTYTVLCVGDDCHLAQDCRLSFSQYDDARSGRRELTCTACGSPAQIQFDPGQVAFNLKEGPSGGWATKSIKENGYRRDRNAVMAKREKDHVFKSKLVPNYEGQEASSWKDVQDHVRSVKGADAAATYDPLVKKAL